MRQRSASLRSRRAKGAGGSETSKRERDDGALTAADYYRVAARLPAARRRRGPREGGALGMPERLQQYVGSDDALLMVVDARLAGALASWIHLIAEDAIGDARAAQARVYVHEAQLFGVEVPRTAPSLRLASVGVWVQQGSGRAVLGSAEADCAGAVDLDVLQATVVTSGAPAATPRLHGMLALAVALLLGRIGRALVRGAVVAPPGGGAWLLVGEEGEGTTTALVRLAAAGWEYLAVEQAILRKDTANGGLAVEGWPGPSAAEADLGAERRRGPADLEGVLALRQAPREETNLRMREDADLLSALLPTSPWLRLDPAGSSGALRALLQGLRLPVFDLRLGLDSYAHPARLAEVLAGLPGGVTR